MRRDRYPSLDFVVALLGAALLFGLVAEVAWGQFPAATALPRRPEYWTANVSGGSPLLLLQQHNATTGARILELRKADATAVAYFEIDGDGLITGAFRPGSFAAASLTSSVGWEGAIAWDDTNDVLKYRNPAGNWVPVAAAGVSGVSGSGTTGRLPKWTASSTLGDSVVSDSGTGTVTLNSASLDVVSGAVKIDGTTRLTSAGAGNLTGLTLTNVLNKVPYTDVTGVFTGATLGADGTVFRMSGATPGFGSITLGSGSAVTGTLGIANGGTNNTSYTANGVVYYDGGGARLATTAAGTADQVFRVPGGGGTPAFGTAAVGGGGTGATSFTAGAVLFGNGTSPLAIDASNLFFDDANNRLGLDTGTPLSTLDVNGSLGLKIRSVTVGTYTAADEAVLLADTGSGSITYELPAAASVNRRVYTVVKTASANTVTIDPNGAETISGAATFAFTTQYETVSFISNGTTWHRIADTGIGYVKPADNVTWTGSHTFARPSGAGPVITQTSSDIGLTVNQLEAGGVSITQSGTHSTTSATPLLEVKRTSVNANLSGALIEAEDNSTGTGALFSGIRASAQAFMVAKTGETRAWRYGTTTRATDHAGQAFWAASSGWGSTATVALTLGSTDVSGSVTVTANGAGIGADPTLTLTFADGVYESQDGTDRAPFVTATWNDNSTGTQAFHAISATTTTLVLKYRGTPVAGSTYRWDYHVMAPR
ncbi:MAG TPA: hypothetical protein VD926_04040 [Acidimicrobiales bacterium]|nr:hypothetical protein [Acidimicrobiales bacterium]